MTAPVIPDLPQYPNPNDPDRANFNREAYDFTVALQPWGDAINAFGSYIGTEIDVTKTLRAPEDLAALPDTATRANKFLTFGSGGDPSLHSYSSVRTLLNVADGATRNIAKTNLISPNDTDVPSTLAVANALATVSSGITPKGNWNAATNTPTLVSSVGTNGDSYDVTVPGTTNLNGETGWQDGDTARFASGVWQRVPGIGVKSFDGRTGSVILNYDTPAQAALASLPIGTKYSTKGADAIGDGGHGTFIVKADEGETVDDYSIVQHANGTLGILQIWGGRYSVCQFGAIGDGVTDNSVAMARAHDRGVPLSAPKGIFIMEDELLITSPCFDLLGSGMGYARNLVPFDPDLEVDVTTFRFVGTGAKSIKTRVKYRGSGADPDDAPISTGFNIQADGVRLAEFKVDLYCDYTDMSPTNYGDDWDVGIFHGSRQDFKATNVQVTGYWRQASIWLDSTRMVNGPELNGYPVTFGAGADGTTLYNVQVSGGKWGLIKQGPKPKSGLLHFGFQYKRAAKLVFSGLPSNNDTFTIDGTETYTFKTTAVARRDVQIGASVSATIDSLIVKLHQDRLVPYDVLTFTKNGSALEIYSTLTTATALADTSANIAIQTMAGAAATQTETISDPAQYYDNTDGLIDDGRNSLGASDTVLINCVICATEHHSFYRRNDIAVPPNKETDTAGGAFKFDGLGGNAVMHRCFAYGTRFQSVEPFCVSIGHGARVRFTDCTADTAVTRWVSTTGAALTTADTYGKYAASDTKSARIQIIGYDDPGDYFPYRINDNQVYSHYYMDANEIHADSIIAAGGNIRAGLKNTGSDTGYMEVLSGAAANIEMRFSNEVMANVGRIRVSPSGGVTFASRVGGTGTLTDILFLSPSGAIRILNAVPVYADDAAATVGGLASGSIYRDAAGVARIKI